MTDFGIDLSHHNKVNDWNAVKGNNITFASVKVTQSTNFVDPMADKFVHSARDAGIRVGGYHFADNSSVPGQVNHFADRIKALGLDSSDSMCPMLDMEMDAVRPRANAFIADFISQFRAKTGIRRILVYANLDWFLHVLKPAQWVDDDVLLWIARFNGDPGKPGFEHPNLALHQHSAHGAVPGIIGNVDRDATIGSFRLADLLVEAAAAAVIVP